MKIEISDATTIKEIRNAFSEKFPYLRLDFFKTDEQSATPFDLAHRITDENVKMGDIRKRHNDGAIIISEDEKVLQLERIFIEKFGIAVQVFRRSGTIWMLTTSTDHMTLNEQNLLGEEMSVSVPGEEPEDIHEQP